MSKNVINRVAKMVLRVLQGQGTAPEPIEGAVQIWKIEKGFCYKVY